jgi:hypothetical protein
MSAAPTGCCFLHVLMILSLVLLIVRTLSSLPTLEREQVGNKIGNLFLA